MKEKLKKLIGTKQFYRTAISIMLPIMFQQLLTSVVGLVDNLMIGMLSEDAIAGVAVSSQIIFVFQIVLIGGLAGSGIFISQFHGANNTEGIDQTFRYKTLFSLLLVILFLIILIFFGKDIIAIVFDNEEVSEEIALALGWDYLRIMLFTFIPFAISTVLSTTLRELGKTKFPMISGIIAIIINIIFNYILIFGKFGAPKLGVAGAAYATILSRIVEMILLIIYSYVNKQSYILDYFKKFRIEKSLFKKITIKGFPLLCNELLWSVGMTVQIFSFSMRGKEVVAALSISSACSNILYISFGALATGIAILVGKELGANNLQTAKDNAWKLLALGFMFSLISGWIMSVLAIFIPGIYNVSDETARLATSFIITVSLLMPIFSFNTGCFFILRSGGATLFTLLFDSSFVWIVVVPLSFCLSKFTTISIVIIYLIVQLTDLIKSILGFTFVKKGIWINNLTKTELQN